MCAIGWNRSVHSDSLLLLGFHFLPADCSSALRLSPLPAAPGGSCCQPYCLSFCFPLPVCPHLLQLASRLPLAVGTYLQIRVNFYCLPPPHECGRHRPLLNPLCFGGAGRHSTCLLADASTDETLLPQQPKYSVNRVSTRRGCFHGYVGCRPVRCRLRWGQKLCGHRVYGSVGGRQHHSRGSNGNSLQTQRTGFSADARIGGQTQRKGRVFDEGVQKAPGKSPVGLG